MTRDAVLALALLLPTAVAHTKRPRLTVYAAASLTSVFPRIDETPRYSFAGSDQLAFQIEQGAPADVYAAASPRYPDQLFRDGLVARPRVFATNTLVVIVPRANPARIRTVYDLRRRGVKLVIGQKGVPVGDYTRTVLARLGLSDALDNVVSDEDDVKLVVAKVAFGEADAGFVYRTDVKPVESRVLRIAVPPEAQPTVRYEVAVVKASRNRTRAEAFVRRLLGPVGREHLRRAGFGLP